MDCVLQIVQQCNLKSRVKLPLQAIKYAASAKLLFGAPSRGRGQVKAGLAKSW